MSKKIISEVKELANKISNSSNFNISELKQEVSVLYDKLTVLEFLEKSISVIENNDSSTTSAETELPKVEVFEEISEVSETIIEAMDFLKVDEVVESDRGIVASNDAVTIEEKIVEVDEAVDNEMTVGASNDAFKIEEQVENDAIKDKMVEENEVVNKEDEASPLNIKIEEAKVANTSKSLHETFDTKKLSLHEELKKNHIQIGLNDRIAFVKRLFDGNQQDFHRVLSQVNTFATIDEVKEFIDTMVRPEHNWDNQEEYAERFMDIIEVRFQ